MYCVLFEVEPREGLADTYFKLAVGMREEVEKIDGFLGVERFASDTRPGLYLSFSRWRDEAALIEWRNVGKHQVMQARGRDDIFAAYRIRIGEETGEDGPRRVLVREHPSAVEASGEKFTAVFDPERSLSIDENSAPKDENARLFRIVRDYTMVDRAEAPQHWA